MGTHSSCRQYQTNMQFLKDKIDQLNRQAWDVRVSDSPVAFELSKEAVRLSREIAYTKGLAEGLRTFGFSHIRLSKNNDALHLLQEAMQLFESLNDIRGRGTIYEYYGIIYRSLGDYKASLEFLYKGLELIEQLSYSEGEALAHYHLGVTYKYLGNFDRALDHLLNSLSISERENLWVPMSYSLNNIGLIYFETEDYENALSYLNQSLEQRRRSGDKWGEAGSLDNIGLCYLKMAQYENAIDFCSQSLTISTSVNDQKGQGNSLFHLGNIYEQSAQYDKALENYERALQIRREVGDRKGEAEASLFLAELYSVENFSRYDIRQAIGLMANALKLGDEVNANDLLSKIHYGFYKICKKNQKANEALMHLEKYISAEKEIHTAAVNKKILNLEISHRVEKSRQEAEMYKLRNVELANLYEEIKKQKEETEIQKRNTEQALLELKAAQTQLIHSEKMASLGELTAGIAHEIQNPLNFVNNFSDLNAELVDELRTELAAGNTQEALEIAGTIKENEEKINYHGKRADGIVKGMLQHSRTSTGQKVLTDINALAEEYLRLGYHGLRGKDKDSTVLVQTDFEKEIGNVNIIPQDIGRVILNLINNAFYAVNEKTKIFQSALDGHDYKPLVTVSTKRLGDKVLVSVSDNGNGIPEKTLDKIFQPFFTTKPTGQGTGLGLSLAYDIVKAHGGEISVNTKEGEGSEFIVELSDQTSL